MLTAYLMGVATGLIPSLILVVILDRRARREHHARHQLLVRLQAQSDQLQAEAADLRRLIS